MTNRHGGFIWYELMTGDPEGAKAFYDDLLDWNIGEPAPGGLDYRMIAAGEDFVGGVLRLTDEMCREGAHPVWLGYIGVDDVDATIAQLKDLGGKVLLPAFDIPEVGRIAMVADPEGAPFYIMRGAVEDSVSNAFKPDAQGHCSWNELAARNPQQALQFYGQLFGWTSSESMPMGENGDYQFLDAGDTRIGALSPCIDPFRSIPWLYYFQVADIDRAVTTTTARGGKILHGPHEIPGGDAIIIGSDPEGVSFALVGPRRGG